MSGPNPGPPAPFMAPDREHKTVLNGARIIEGAVIGVVAAILSSVITTAKIEERMQFLLSSQNDLKSQVAELRRDIYRPRWDTHPTPPPRGQTMQLCPKPEDPAPLGLWL